jgi:hypothetical protein
MSSGTAVALGAARGAVGAMAMSGMRRLTAGLGLVEKEPPEALAEASVAGRFLTRLPVERRDDAIELAHWTFGAVGGAAFSALAPPAFRRRLGPFYGLAIWAAFETVVAPLLGFPHAKRRTVASRTFIAADHLLYGASVGGALGAEQE